MHLPAIDLRLIDAFLDDGHRWGGLVKPGFWLHDAIRGTHSVADAAVIEQVGAAHGFGPDHDELARSYDEIRQVIARFPCDDDGRTIVSDVMLEATFGPNWAGVVELLQAAEGQPLTRSSGLADWSAVESAIAASGDPLRWHSAIGAAERVSAAVWPGLRACESPLVDAMAVVAAGTVVAQRGLTKSAQRLTSAWRRLSGVRMVELVAV